MALNTTAGDAAADSYASLADTDAYFTARGIATWDGTDAVKEAALRRATSYLDNQYRDLWKGYRSAETQALAWPRISRGDEKSIRNGFILSLGIVDADGFELATDEVPLQVQRACMEAALLILTGTSLEPTMVRGGQVVRERKRVGPLEKETEYASGASARDRYTVIEGLLRGLVTSVPGATSGTVMLSRN